MDAATCVVAVVLLLVYKTEVKALLRAVAAVLRQD